MNPGQALAASLRRIVGVMIALLLALVLIAGVAWIWSGRQASLDWAWQRLAEPHGLVAEGLSGSLREGLHAQRLQARVGNTHLDLQDVTLAWDPVFLLDGVIRITGLRVTRLRVQPQDEPNDAPRLPSAPPDSLALPLAVRVDHASIGQLAWDGRLPLQAQDVAAAYRYEPRAGRHQLTLLDARVASGRYRGAWTQADLPPLGLNAWLRGDVDAGTLVDPLRLRVVADAAGTLDALRVQLHLQAAGVPTRAAHAPAATVQARITPWQAPFVPQASARLRQVDLATLWPHAPRTRLQGLLQVAPGPAGPQDPWRLQVHLDNLLPGPWDRQYLPFSHAQGEVSWSRAAISVSPLRVDIGVRGQGGRLEGAGRWRARQGWDADLRLAGVQAQALHSALSAQSAGARPAAFDGQLQARAHAGTTHFDLSLRATAGAGPAGGRDATAPAPGPADAVIGLQSLSANGHWRSGGLALQARARGGASRGRQSLDFDIAAQVQHGAGASAPWQARFEQVHLALADPRTGTGTWSLTLQEPVDLRIDRRGHWVVGAGQALLQAPVRSDKQAARLSWNPVRGRQGEWHSSGQLTGLPLSWLKLANPAKSEGSGSLATGVGADGGMVFDAQWEAHLARALRLSARIARVRGDITLLAETAEGTPVRVAAGVREASLTLDSEGEALRLALRWASERAGTVVGELSTRLTRTGTGGWRWPGQTPIAGRVQARLPRIAAWSALAPPGWRLRGALMADITVGGTRGDPLLSGPVQADDLALRSVVDGIALERGRLRARLDRQRLLIDEWTWQTGRSGTLRASGEAGWRPGQAGQPGGLFAQVDAQIDHLHASVRSDRQVTVSGAVSARLDPAQLALEGRVRIDRARITVPDTPVPRLGDDVTVRHLPDGTQSPWGAGEEAALRALRLDMAVDLGPDFRVSGRGVDTGVQGQLRVTGTSFAQPRLAGTVSSVNGHYTAYGQRLELRRGLLQFTGPHDDPVLDVIAVRPHLDPPVGIQVTGRARAPVLRLWSQEPATEAEKLSWLVLGRSAAAGSAETVLLEQAALALLARRAGLGAGGIASAFGLDEFTLRREGEQGAAITLGKRLGRKLYAVYERSLSGALGTLYILYDLTARLTLRAQAGDRTGLDLVYALSFDHVLAAPSGPPADTPPPR